MVCDFAPPAAAFYDKNQIKTVKIRRQICKYVRTACFWRLQQKPDVSAPNYKPKNVIIL